MKTPTTDVVTTSISQALGYPTATPLRRLKGKMALVWDKTGGQGKKGPWTKQSGLIEDNGNKMVFTVWNFKGDLSDSKGKEVVFFNSNENRKSALVLEDDYKDPTKRSLKVDGKQCSVFIDGISNEVPADDIPMEHDASGAPVSNEPKNPPKANVAPKKAIPEGGVNEVKKAVMQLANLRKICDDSAAFLYPDSESDFVKEIGTSIYIQATRDGLHHKLPNNKPLSKKDETETYVKENLEEKEDEIF